MTTIKFKMLGGTCKQHSISIMIIIYFFRFTLAIAHILIIVLRLENANIKYSLTFQVSTIIFNNITTTE